MAKHERPRPQPSRRRLLGLCAVGLAGAAALSACRWDPPAQPAASPGATSDGSADPVGPDATLVAETAAAVLTTRAVAAATDGAQGIAFLGLHDAHLGALAATGGVPDGLLEPAAQPGAAADPSSTPSPTAQPGGVRRLRASESGLATVFDAAAERAQSGELARLFASGAAAVHQHLTRAGGPQSTPETGPTGSAPGTGTTGSTGSTESAEPSGLVEAMQQALAAEHSAVHLLGSAGARSATEGSLRVLLTDAYRAHRATRDLLRTAIVEAGQEPVAAAVTYSTDVDGPSPEPGLEAALAALDDCARAWAGVVAHTPAGQRAWGIETLRACALHRVVLGADPEQWPGAPDLA